MQSNSSWPAVSHNISLTSSPFTLKEGEVLKFGILQKCSPYPLLQEVHADGLLVLCCEDSLAILLDHRRLSNSAISHDHHLQEWVSSPFRIVTTGCWIRHDLSKNGHVDNKRLPKKLEVKEIILLIGIFWLYGNADAQSGCQLAKRLSTEMKNIFSCLLMPIYCVIGCACYTTPMQLMTV